MAKEVATTKWCPCCHSSQKIKGFRSFRCRECWLAAGKPKVETLFKAMDKPKATPKKVAKKATKREPEKKVKLLEDRKPVRRKKKPKKKVVKKKK